MTSDSDDFCSFLREKTGLYLNPGNQYRGEGRSFVRLNAACPKSLLKEGLERFARGIRAYKEEGAGRISE